MPSINKNSKKSKIKMEQGKTKRKMERILKKKRKELKT